jgi:hypothetical protein
LAKVWASTCLRRSLYRYRNGSEEGSFASHRGAKDLVAVVPQVKYENGVEEQVFYELARVPTWRNKRETTASVGKDCRGFEHNTRHKRVRVERGMLSTHTWR